MKSIIILFCVLCYCGCNNEKNHACPNRLDLQMKFYDVGINNLTDTSYYHYVVVKNYNSKCIDSACIADAVYSYFSNVHLKKPIVSISLYKPSADFYEGETSQDWSELNKSCIAEVFLDNKGKIDGFRFYDSNGVDFIEDKKWSPR